MSRVGRLPVAVPEGVEVELKDSGITVVGPGGRLSRRLHPSMRVERTEAGIQVSRPSNDGQHRALHGLTRTLVANMVEGVTKGFMRELELVGVGYRASKAGQDVVLTLGFSHPIRYAPPPGITIDVPDATHMSVRGIDKELVGQVASKLRSLRLPEPYKGKGVLYRGETVRRKAGKTGKATTQPGAA